MGNSLFIALLNPAISLVLAVAFVAIWTYRRRNYLMVASVGYVMSGVGFLMQYFDIPGAFEFGRMVSAAAFLIAALCLAVAILSHFGRPVPAVAFGVLGIGGFLVFCWFMLVSPNLTWRIYTLNFAIGGICLFIATELRLIWRTGLVEKILFVLCLLSAASFFLRTIIAMRLHGGAYQTYDGLYTSPYWTSTLLCHALLSLLIALTLLASAALDVVASLKAETHTDPLSGLLNRRGFEEKGRMLLERCQKAGFPVSLVLADLDHFKSVNDIYGHAVGDKVIADFAAKLRTAAGARGVAGRIGGEEFAVLLPVADLASARLLAEAVRSIFSLTGIEGLPPTRRLSASFGVATRNKGEDLNLLMRRADEALYQAKKNGRDSVRVAYERPDPGSALTQAH